MSKSNSHSLNARKNFNYDDDDDFKVSQPKKKRAKEVKTKQQIYERKSEGIKKLTTKTKSQNIPEEIPENQIAVQEPRTRIDYLCLPRINEVKLNEKRENEVLKSIEVPELEEMNYQIVKEKEQPENELKLKLVSERSLCSPIEKMKSTKPIQLLNSASNVNNNPRKTVLRLGLSRKRPTKSLHSLININSG